MIRAHLTSLIWGWKRLHARWHKWRSVWVSVRNVKLGIAQHSWKALMIMGNRNQCGDETDIVTDTLSILYKPMTLATPSFNQKLSMKQLINSHLGIFRPFCGALTFPLIHNRRREVKRQFCFSLRAYFTIQSETLQCLHTALRHNR